jgi:hypothetical protein
MIMFDPNKKSANAEHHQSLFAFFTDRANTAVSEGTWEESLASMMKCQYTLRSMWSCSIQTKSQPRLSIKPDSLFIGQRLRS